MHTFLHAQVQIGSDIDGKELGDFFGSDVSLSSDGTTVALRVIGMMAMEFTLSNQ
jgi:hypothetical protein